MAKLATRLLKAGLPHGYVNRVVRELSDHQVDLGAENTAKLGVSDDLTQHMIWEYRRARWTGRVPLLGFVLLPLPVLFVIWNLYYALTILPLIFMHPELENFDWSSHTLYETNPLLASTLMVIYFGGKVIPFAGGMWLFLRLTERSGRGVAWMLLAGVVMSLIAMFLVRTSISIPIAPSDHGVHFSLEIGTLEDQLFHYGEQIAQGVTPLLIALAVAARTLWAGRKLTHQWANEERTPLGVQGN